ncbi:MAG: flippase [Salibacteraceae bacterium]
MGIVRRQAINNSIFNYIGMVIGYVNVVILFPILLSPEEFGLTRMLTSMAIIFAQLSAIGTPRIIIRFYPFFQRDASSRNNGLLPISLIIGLIGWVIITAGLFVFKDVLISGQDSELFKTFYWTIPLLTFLTMISRIFEAYLKVLFHSSFTAFLNNIFIKLLWLGVTVAYFYNLISLEGFVWIYCSVQGLLVLAMIIYLSKIGHFSLSANRLYYRWRVLKNMVRYGSFSILDNTNVALMNNVDKVMIGYLISDNLKSVAVYTVAAHLSTIVTIPANSMNRVLVPMISRSWRNKQMDRVKEVYHQSTLINLITTGGLFALVWSNIDGIMFLVEKDYATGIYAMLLLMISRVMSVSFGINGDLILVSKHYWFNSVSGVILIACMVAFNLILIPSYGILGAALGTLLARSLYNFIRYSFLLRLTKLQPFNRNNFKALVIIVMTFVLGYFIQFNGLHPLMELVVKGFILSVAFALPMYWLNVSTDLNQMVDESFRKLLRVIRK